MAYSFATELWIWDARKRRKLSPDCRVLLGDDFVDSPRVLRENVVTARVVRFTGEGGLRGVCPE